jgi:hypothetical protein
VTHFSLRRCRPIDDQILYRATAAPFGQGWNNELLGSLMLGSLKLVIDKARIIKLVKDNKLKSLFGSARYMLTSAHEQLVKIIKKILF